MKRIFISLLLIVASFSAKAQIDFSLQAGINISNLKTTVNGKHDGYDPALGYLFAAEITFPAGGFLLQTGLQYEHYSTRLDVTNTSGNDGVSYAEHISGKAHAAFLNIPFKFLYKVPSGKNNFILGAGPYIGIGLSGHSKGSTTETSTSSGNITSVNSSVSDNAIKFGSATGELKRINAGIGLNLNYLLQNNIYFSIYSNLGLTNLNNQQSSSTKAVAAGFTLGYVFSNKGKK